MDRPLPFTRFLSLLMGLYIAFGFALMLSVADNSLSKSGTLPIPPTIFAIIFLTSILAIVLLRDFVRNEATTQIGMILRSNTALTLPFGFLAFLSLAFALRPEAYWGDGKKWIYLQTYDYAIFLAAMLVPSIAMVRRYFRFFVTIGLLTLLGSIWYEVQNPATFSSVPNRAAGFPGNSNWGALSTVMICAVSLGYRDGRSRILDFAILSATGLGLYFTLSRSGMMNFGLLLVFYAAVALLTGKDRAKTALSLALSMSFLISFLLIVVPLASQNSELMGGGSKAQNRILALFDGELVDDGSAADRMEAARETLDMINLAPVLGHGTGFNRKMRQTPHNLYLKLWVDSGIFGLATWLVLLASAFWMFTSRRYRPGQALTLVTLFGGLFSHNILEQRTFLLLLGTTGGMSLFEAASLARRTSALSALITKADRTQLPASLRALQS